MLISIKFLLQFFTNFPFFLHNLVQVGYSITGFPFHVPFSDVVGESSNLGTLIHKKNKPLIASNLAQHASWQHDNQSPLCSLYKNDSLDTYVSPTFHISFDVSQHQISCIPDYSPQIWLSRSVKVRHYLKKFGTLEMFQN